MKRWPFWIIILFLLFFILSSPASAGSEARTFFGWVGDQAEAAATFLDGLFTDDESPTPVPPDDGGTTDTTDLFDTSMGPVIVIDAAAV